MAKNIVDLFVALDFHKPVIVGYAMGSTIAQEIAIQHPSKLSALILLSTVAKWSDSAVEKIEKLFSLKYQNNKELYYQYLFDMAFGSAYKEHHSLSDFKKEMKDNLFMQTKADELRQLNVLKTFDSRSRLDKINVPTLILAPDEEQLSLLEDAKLVADKIGTKAQLSIIHNSGHCSLVEQPLSVYGKILNFLSKLTHTNE